MKHKAGYEHRVFINLGGIEEFYLIMSWKWDDTKGMTEFDFKTPKVCFKYYLLKLREPLLNHLPKLKTTTTSYLDKIKKGA